MLIAFSTPYTTLKLNKFIANCTKNMLQANFENNTVERIRSDPNHVARANWELQLNENDNKLWFHKNLKVRGR